MNLATLLTNAGNLFFSHQDAPRDHDDGVELEEPEYTTIDLHQRDGDDDDDDDDAEVDECSVVDSVDDYYNKRFRFVPTRAGDLLLGIAFLGEEWYLPTDHPLARLLLKNDYLPINQESHSNLLRYTHDMVTLSQQSLVQLMKDKASNISDEGALWTTE
jgi:hypothetical protein